MHNLWRVTGIYGAYNNRSIAERVATYYRTHGKPYAKVLPLPLNPYAEDIKNHAAVTVPRAAINEEEGGE